MSLNEARANYEMRGQTCSLYRTLEWCRL